MLPGRGRWAGFSTSRWKIQGWVDFQAFLRRTVGVSLFIAPFYAGGMQHPAACNPRRCRHCSIMHLSDNDLPADPKAQRTADRKRWLRAFNLSLAYVLAMLVMFSLQGSVDLRGWMVQPWSVDGLKGLVGAPLLHGSIDHLAANAISMLMLGTLAGGMYPRATARAVPLAWIGSGLGAWLLGTAGSH